MGWFSKKGSSDTKARIEELKKKIQSEQNAYAQSASQVSAQPTAPVAPAQPAAPVATPVQPAAPAQPAPVAATPQAPTRAPPAPATIEIPIEEPPQEHHPRAHHARAPKLDDAISELHERSSRPRHVPSHSHAAPHETASAGVVLDLGEGMSLNLPIRNRMQLDDFLAIAQRVRELKRLERTY